MYGLHFVSRKFPITLNINNRFLAFVLQKRCAQVVFLLHCVEFIRFFHGKLFFFKYFVFSWYFTRNCKKNKNLFYTKGASNKRRL